MLQQHLQLISSLILWEVFADLCIKKVNLNRKMYKLSKIFLTISEIFRDLDGPKAPDYLPSYAVCLLKENFACSFLSRILSHNDQNESKVQNFFEN